MKILGITFSDSLKWDHHISNILSVASKRLYVIRRLRDFVKPKDIIHVYHAIITSVFMYASPVFVSLPSKLLSKLERFQKRAHKIICGSDCSCDLFPPVSSRFSEAAVRLLLISEANPSHPLHSYVPRRLPASNRLAMPFCASSRRLLSFFPWTVDLYNSYLNS